MKTFFILFCIVFFYFYLVSLKYRNDKKLIMVFGRKGSGKNTLFTKLSVKYNRMGYHVFSDSEIFNTYKLNTDWIGKYDFPRNSVLFVQEAGITWDNRNFKSFSSEVRNFFKLQRHYGIIVYLASQSFDVDKKLRDLCDEMYLCVNYMGIFSIAKKIDKRITIHNASDENDGESFLTETYSFGFPWEWKYTYIPRWIRFFNSFEAPYFGRSVERSRYIFNNEHELYKEIDWRYYKVREIQNFVENQARKVQDQVQSFVVSDDLFDFCIGGNNLLSSD